MGIRRPKDSNLAGIIRLLWEIEMNADVLWVRWMRKKYLRGSSIWCSRPPQTCSWAWRGILKARSLATNLLVYKVGDGSAMKFLLDPWLGQPPIWLRVGDRLRQDLAIDLTCKVGSFITNQRWILPPHHGGDA